MRSEKKLKNLKNGMKNNLYEVNSLTTITIY